MTEEVHEDWMDATLIIIEQTLSIGKENIFLKLRQRKPGRLGQYQKLDALQQEWIVEESGLRFIVNLTDYLDTGLFLDHRTTRQMVRQEAAGKTMLNLFAYTGSFSVYAAAGGAREVTTVDLSKTYLAWAEKNMQVNGFTDVRFTYVHADVLQYLKTLPENHFDLIVMDPPTFSNSKRMDDFLDIQQDHVSLIRDCLRSMKTGGILYFSTNYRKFILDTNKIPAASIKDITKQTTPFDFEGKLMRWCFKIVK